MIIGLVLAAAFAFGLMWVLLLHVRADPAAIRGYGADHWIRYDTGQIVRGAELTAACEQILSDETIAYVHIRSKFGCFQCRVDRAG